MSAPSLLVVVLLAVAAPASAAQLELGWDARANWDSNPLRSPNDENADAAFYGGPNFGLRDRGRRLEYFLDYRLRYEQYVDISSANGFEHFVSGNASWRVSPRSQLSVTQLFSRTRGLALNFIEPVPGIDPVDAAGELQLRREPTIRNTTTATYTRHLSRVWSFESSLDGTLYDYEDDLRAGVTSLRGSGQVVRPLGERAMVGFGSAVTRQDFGDTERSIGTGTTIFEGFGVFRYRISPTIDFSFSGGPAWNQPDDVGGESMAPRNAVATDQGGVDRLIDPSRCVLAVPDVPAGTVSISSCPRRTLDVFPPGPSPGDLVSALIPGAAIDTRELRFDEVDILGESEEPDGSVTFFGRAGLTKRWRTVNSELSYTRRASTSSGIGSTNIDLALLTVHWRPDRRRWSISGRASWTMQTSATEQPITESLLSPVGESVWVDSAGRIYDGPVPGATEVPNAARVVGVRTVGFSDSGLEWETFAVDVRARRQFGQHLVATASAGWWRQETTGDFLEPTTIDNVRFQVGVTWSLDPIEF